jgi:hypothetical protein
MKLQPPLLFVRPNLAFWVESNSDGYTSATLQAFGEGCFEGTWCLDVAGGRWEISQATLVEKPRLLDRLLPWRRVRVDVQLGPRMQANVSEVVEELCQILSDPEYEWFKGPSPDELRSRLRMARTFEDVISVAKTDGA